MSSSDEEAKMVEAGEMVANKILNNKLLNLFILSFASRVKTFFKKT